uniref:protein kinase domain-containing protein n=1 Tax=Sphingosinicella sp. CPCC 101087 TaxID=2497754 RepID=UPI00101E14D6
RVRRIGRYEIEERIGEGAMADVYRARDPEIGRPIAVKILKAELRADQEIVARFLREARAAGSLSHPNIVTIYDVGEADGYPYIAMEYLDMVALDQHIRTSGALAVESVLSLGTQLARALHYAHEAGVIHRDIKPSNIMLCEGGRVAKILDFGIARIGEPDRVRAELNALRTQVGQVLGTPRYMSPEQALGLTIDRRSDLFSMGVVLYEMLTGRMAFDGASLATLAVQITHHEPQPLRNVLPGCPKGLQYLIERLLAKEPDKRFATGADLAEALDRERSALAGTRLGRGLPLRWRLSLTISAAMAIALALMAVAMLDRQYRSMQQMTLTSATTIATFIANNVALRAVENAGLPASQQDWAPVQAFVQAAAQDSTVRRLVVVDASGIVRGSSDPRVIGTRDRVPAGETFLSEGPHERISATAEEDFRIRRTVRYADQDFGAVELVMSRAELAAATRNALWLMAGLAFMLALVIIVVSHATARMIVRPLRQLKSALDEAAGGNLQFRLSHRRRDEFGVLFDSFNRMADAAEGGAFAPAIPATSLEETRIHPTTEPYSAEARRTA